MLLPVAFSQRKRTHPISMMLHDLERIEGRDEGEEDGERERQDEGKDREWRSWVEDKPAQCLSRPWRCCRNVSHWRRFPSTNLNVLYATSSFLIRFPTTLALGQQNSLIALRQLSALHRTLGVS
ncbi:hypothetical protein M405DRAFT_806631 [Rhizopogon salebrosus TDB-379]|nr:hypothetical protein M405DRAFT_806631 [Rhizopogon salebrosus TDB-379]